MQSSHSYMFMQLTALNISLQQMFSKRFANSVWSDSSRSRSWSRMWNEQWEETWEYTCAAHSVCEVKQISGKCGAIIVRNPRVVASSRPLRDDFPPLSIESEKDKVENYFQSKYPNEKWVVATGISFFEPSNNDGWEPAVTCADGYVVTGHSQKLVQGLALTGVRLLCSATKDKMRYNVVPYHITTETSHYGNWTKEV